MTPPAAHSHFPAADVRATDPEDGHEGDADHAEQASPEETFRARLVGPQHGRLLHHLTNAGGGGGGGGGIVYRLLIEK